MSTHKSQEVSWKTLIDDAESALKECRDKMSLLKKSIVFFRKQDMCRAPFPLHRSKNVTTHEDLS